MNDLLKLKSKSRIHRTRIPIFNESAKEYQQKLKAAKSGKYELDDYDKKVISILMDQFGVLPGNI